MQTDLVLCRTGKALLTVVLPLIVCRDTTFVLWATTLDARCSAAIRPLWTKSCGEGIVACVNEAYEAIMKLVANIRRVSATT